MQGRAEVFLDQGAGGARDDAWPFAAGAGDDADLCIGAEPRGAPFLGQLQEQTQTFVGGHVVALGGPVVTATFGAGFVGLDVQQDERVESGVVVLLHSVEHALRQPVGFRAHQRRRTAELVVLQSEQPRGGGVDAGGVDDVHRHAGSAGTDHQIGVGRGGERVAGGEQDDLLGGGLFDQGLAPAFDAFAVEDLDGRLQERHHLVVAAAAKDGGVELRVDLVGGLDAPQALDGDVCHVVQAEADQVECHNAGRPRGFEGFGATGLLSQAPFAPTMARALGISVRSQDAEATRRRLLAADVLRNDLKVLTREGRVVFPVTAAIDDLVAEEAEFEPRVVRPRDYTDLLPDGLRAEAPRAHDVLGDIVIIKIPTVLWADRRTLGGALLSFHGARAVFHDQGVTGEFRTRDLECIAGASDSSTTVAENGVRLRIDPAKAYFSPRLADERARITAVCRPGETVIDLFGGVAPLGIQLAKAGHKVVTVDLNPDATRLAAENAALNNVDIEVHTGDAREVAKGLVPADRVVMNLPHGAKHFVDVGVSLVVAGGMVHYHEIMRKDALTARQAELVDQIAGLGRSAHIRNVRHVRDYSTDEAHFAFDIEVA